MLLTLLAEEIAKDKKPSCGQTFAGLFSAMLTIVAGLYAVSRFPYA
jgi:hypothetical protein